MQKIPQSKRFSEAQQAQLDTRLTKAVNPQIWRHDRWSMLGKAWAEKRPDRLYLVKGRLVEELHVCDRNHKSQLKKYRTCDFRHQSSESTRCLRRCKQQTLGHRAKHSWHYNPLTNNPNFILWAGPSEWLQCAEFTHWGGPWLAPSSTLSRSENTDVWGNDCQLILSSSDHT